MVVGLWDLMSGFRVRVRATLNSSPNRMYTSIDVSMPNSNSNPNPNLNTLALNPNLITLTLEIGGQLKCQYKMDKYGGNGMDGEAKSNSDCKGGTRHDTSLSLLTERFVGKCYRMAIHTNSPDLRNSTGLVELGVVV